jgi:hypothetical protein
LPKCQSSRRIPFPGLSQASSKEVNLIQFSSFLTHNALPIRNRKSSRYSVLRSIYEIEENVLRLDVTMDDLFLMDVIEPLANLAHDWTGIRLFHSMRFSQKLQQLSSSAVFNQKVNVFFILEVTVKGSNIPMIQVKLDA